MSLRIKSSKHDQGAILVFAVFFVLVILMIAAIGLGLGFVVTNKSRVQNIANMVALAALEVSVRDGTSLNVAAQADSILAANKIPGIAEWSSFSKTVADGGAGTIVFGTWYFADPDGEGFGEDPCFVGGQVGYPCFVSTSDGSYTPGVNSVRVRLIGNSSSNLVLAPFLRIFGASAKPFNTQAIATLAGQCSVVLMDVSKSMTYDTHKPRYDPLLLPPVVNPSQFIYNINIGPDPENNPNCPADPALRKSSLCDLKQTRDPDLPIDPLVHHRSDYRVAPGMANQNIIVDRFVSAGDAYAVYRGPQPMSDLFMGMNAALRKLYQRSRGSFWRGIGYAGLTADTTHTPNPVPKIGFGSDPGPLIQVSNTGNMGTFDTIRQVVNVPLGSNFLNHGWFAPPFAINSVDSSSNEDPSFEQSNLSGAIETALDWFDGRGLNGGMSCPVNYQKTIYLMTDGIINCIKTANNPAYECENTYLGFEKARDQLLNTIVPELQRKKIQVNVVVAGETIGTHFLNILAPPGYATTSGSKFFSPQEAIANGYGAYSHPNQDQKIVLEEPSVPLLQFIPWCESNYGGGLPCPPPYPLKHLNDYAMRHIGQLDTVFREPLSVMAQLAIDTGGVFCPVLPLSPSGYNAGPNGKIIFDDSYRTDGKPQLYAVEKQTIPEQIAECFESKWTNKFMLVAKEGAAEVAQPQAGP